MPLWPPPQRALTRKLQLSTQCCAFKHVQKLKETKAPKKLCASAQ